MNLKGWFEYLQNAHKNLNKMAKYVFWFNKYWDVQRRKGVFSLFEQIIKMTKKNSLDFYRKICPNLLILFLAQSIHRFTCWPPLDQCALVEKKLYSKLLKTKDLIGNNFNTLSFNDALGNLCFIVLLRFLRRVGTNNYDMIGK